MVFTPVALFGGPLAKSEDDAMLTRERKTVQPFLNPIMMKDSIDEKCYNNINSILKWWEKGKRVLINKRRLGASLVRGRHSLFQEDKVPKATTSRFTFPLVGSIGKHGMQQWRIWISSGGVKRIVR
jgi:hypothetical protein